MRRASGSLPRWTLWAGLVATLLGIVLALYGVRDRLEGDFRRAVGEQVGDSLNLYVRTPRK